MMTQQQKSFPNGQKKFKKSRFINDENKTIVIVTRHGQRLDYQLLKEHGINWIERSDGRPFDPPLTSIGHEQARLLGQKIHEVLNDKFDGMKLSHVYTSPLIRCIQTAQSTIISYHEESIKGEEHNECNSVPPLKLENGLIESVSHNWYRSWCLPRSDSTWGFKDGETVENNGDIQDEHIHPKALVPVTDLILSEQDLKQRSFQIDHNYESYFPLAERNYNWKNVERRKDQYERLEETARTLAKKHKGETILLVSHGGPNVHLYEVLTGKSFQSFGDNGNCGYTACSIYVFGDGDEVEEIMTNNTDHLKPLLV